MSMRELISNEQLICCEPSTTVKRVAEMMKENNVGAVVVMEENKPTGIVTDRDLVVRFLADSQDKELDGPISDYMTQDVATLSADSGLFQLIQTMRESKVRRVLLVNEDGELEQLVSFGDVFQLLGEEIQALSAPVCPEEPKIRRVV